MVKRMIVGMAAAAIVSAATTFGIVKASEPHYPNYIVINRTNADGTTNCDLTLRKDISDLLRSYYADGTVRDDLCVTKVDLTQAGIDNLPEQLGDKLQGIYAATDSNGNPVPISIYLPMVGK